MKCSEGSQLKLKTQCHWLCLRLEMELKKPVPLIFLNLELKPRTGTGFHQFFSSSIQRKKKKEKSWIWILIDLRTGTEELEQSKSFYFSRFSAGTKELAIPVYVVSTVCNKTLKACVSFFDFQPSKGKKPKLNWILITTNFQNSLPRFKGASHIVLCSHNSPAFLRNFHAIFNEKWNLLRSSEKLHQREDDKAIREEFFDLEAVREEKLG